MKTLGIILMGLAIGARRRRARNAATRCDNSASPHTTATVLSAPSRRPWAGIPHLSLPPAPDGASCFSIYCPIWNRAISTIAPRDGVPHPCAESFLLPISRLPQTRYFEGDGVPHPCAESFLLPRLRRSCCSHPDGERFGTNVVKLIPILMANASEPTSLS
jgi:hypothetical protein